MFTITPLFRFDAGEAAFLRLAGNKAFGIFCLNIIPILYESKTNTTFMEHGSNLIERIKSDLNSI
jgi:hypothetical protein